VIFNNHFITNLPFRLQTDRQIRLNALPIYAGVGNNNLAYNMHSVEAILHWGCMPCEFC